MGPDFEEMAASGIFTVDELMSYVVTHLDARSMPDLIALANRRGWLRDFHAWLKAVATGAEMVRGGGRIEPTHEAKEAAQEWLAEEPRATTTVDLRDEEGATIPRGTAIVMVQSVGAGRWLCATEADAAAWVTVDDAELAVEPIPFYELAMQVDAESRLFETPASCGSLSPPRLQAA